MDLVGAATGDPAAAAAPRIHGAVPTAAVACALGAQWQCACAGAAAAGILAEGPLRHCHWQPPSRHPWRLPETHRLQGACTLNSEGWIELEGRAHDHEGFYVLNTLVEFLDPAVLVPYMPGVWGLLFTRLQNPSSKTPKLVRSLTVFIGLFASKHGSAALDDSVSKVQPGEPPPVISAFLPCRM
eukprot:1194485-Prorocentrum_minimum.AAC.3